MLTVYTNNWVWMASDKMNTTSINTQTSLCSPQELSSKSTWKCSQAATLWNVSEITGQAWLQTSTFLPSWRKPFLYSYPPACLEPELFPVSLKGSSASINCEALNHFAYLDKMLCWICDVGYQKRVVTQSQWSKNTQNQKELLSTPDYRLICWCTRNRLLRSRKLTQYIVHASVTLSRVKMIYWTDCY